MAWTAVTWAIDTLVASAMSRAVLPCVTKLVTASTGAAGGPAPGSPR
ncbi:hypothetical protein [Amycolatopsis sp. NPDC059657]